MIAYDLTPGWFEILANTEPVVQATINVAICDEMHSKQEGFAYNQLGYNADCVYGTEETSWGAIKSMMD